MPRPLCSPRRTTRDSNPLKVAFFDPVPDWPDRPLTNIKSTGKTSVCDGHPERDCRFRAIGDIKAKKRFLSSNNSNGLSLYHGRERPKGTYRFLWRSYLRKSALRGADAEGAPTGTTVYAAMEKTGDRRSMCVLEKRPEPDALPAEAGMW